MRISFIGAGRLAQALARALFEKGYIIDYVYSRQSTKAQALAQQVQARASTDLAEIPPSSDWRILAVSDDAIEAVAQQLGPSSVPLLHCSGATSVDVLAPYSERQGVFYPLQSFSVGKDVFWQDVPFLLHSTNELLLRQMQEVAQALSQRVYHIDDAQRRRLHVAGVFINNFGHYLGVTARALCEEKNIPFEILEPLTQATLQNILHINAWDLQTGPARRGDKNTQEAHRQELEAHPTLQHLYELLSTQIEQRYLSPTKK